MVNVHVSGQLPLVVLLQQVALAVLEVCPRDLHDPVVLDPRAMRVAGQRDGASQIELQLALLERSANRHAGGLLVLELGYECW